MCEWLSGGGIRLRQEEERRKEKEGVFHSSKNWRILDSGALNREKYIIKSRSKVQSVSSQVKYMNSYIGWMSFEHKMSSYLRSWPPSLLAFLVADPLRNWLPS